MKERLIIGFLGLFILLMTGCTSTKSSEVNILATSDLHGFMPYELSSYIQGEKSKRKNTIVVDAGDFIDYGTPGSTMNKYCFDRDCDDDRNHKYVEFPFAKEIKEIGYDTVVLGNHEFLFNSKAQLDDIVSDFEKQNIDILSANTHKKNGDNYLKPYAMKKVSTTDGDVKIGILGLTVKEVGQRYETLKDGTVKPLGDGLKELDDFNGSLYMSDLVEEAKKWVPVMKKENPDIILAVVHSGEKKKGDKLPENRIQELAQEVDGIDAIVAGHTHKDFDQHNYKNKSGETVIVTQPGKYGEAISKINFQLEKNNNKWDIVEKSSKVTNFEKSQEDKNFDLLSRKLVDTTLYFEKKPKDKSYKNLSLSKLTPFKWDKAYVFDTNTSPETIYKTIGYKWKDIKKAESEDMVQMIFMNNKKVVCQLYGYEQLLWADFNFDKSEFKNGVVTLYPNINDKFEVTLDKVWSFMKLKHLK